MQISGGQRYQAPRTVSRDCEALGHLILNNQMALPTNQRMGQHAISDFVGLVLLKRHCLLIKIEISWQQGQR